MATARIAGSGKQCVSANTSSSSSSRQGLVAAPSAWRPMVRTARTLQYARRQSIIVNTYPEPETEKERSPIDFPQEWLTPQPSRRPDIFPELEKLDTPMPKPMPGDPEQPEDEEEEDKKKKENPDPEEDDPDTEKPDEAPEE